jgi:hypothetical protein
VSLQREYAEQFLLLLGDDLGHDIVEQDIPSVPIGDCSVMRLIWLNAA